MTQEKSEPQPKASELEYKNSEATDPTEKSKLAQLNAGLLMMSFKHELAEPGYTAIGRHTYEHDVINKRHSYASDLERVIAELKLTSVLLSEVSEYKQTEYKTHQPEELITYYTGIFLDQVHQAKDKLVRLIDYMAAEGPRKREYDEPEHAKVGKLITKHKKLLEEIGIVELLQEWNTDGRPIKVALNRRTEHHHRVSRLRLSDDFHGVSVSRTLLNPQSEAQLSDYGKKYMAELGEKSLKKLKDDTVAKQRATIAAIENSIEAIAEKLIDHYSVPTDAKDLARIAGEWIDFLSSLNIKNEASLGKISPEFKELLDQAVGTLTNDPKLPIISIYLVGSIGRGEFVKGSSDINLIVIMENYTKSFDNEMPITMNVMSEQDFLSEEHKRERFIVWSDGVLLHGKEYKFTDKDFPKPGMLLALLLNRGVIQKLESLQQEIEELENPDYITLRLYTAKVVKIVMDYDFATAMTNKPFFSASRAKKLAHTKAEFPEGTRTLILEQIYKGVNISLDSLKGLVAAGLETMRRTYPKLEELEVQEKADKLSKRTSNA